MICRQVVCSKDRKLSNGVCLSAITKYNVTCSSVFLQLTTIFHDKIDYPSDVREKSMLSRNIRKAFEDRIGLHYTILKFLTFYKLDTSRQIDYVVIYTETAFDNSSHKDAYIASVFQLGDLHVLDFRGQHIHWIVYIDIYNMTEDYSSATIFVPSEINWTKVDVLTTNLDHYHANMCPSYETTPLNKLSVCPYVNIGRHEVPFKNENDILTVSSDDKRKVTLFRWEYEIHLDRISVCFEKFLDLYDYISVTGMGASMGCSSMYTEQVLFLATVCLVIVISCIL